MKISKEMMKRHVQLSNDFFDGTIELCKKEGNGPTFALDAMSAQVQMCQVLMFGFMASIRKEEHISTIYADMQEMSLRGLDMLVDEPRILNQFSETIAKEPTQSLRDTVKLFEELRACKKS